MAIKLAQRGFWRGTKKYLPKVYSSSNSFVNFVSCKSGKILKSAHRSFEKVMGDSFNGVKGTSSFAFHLPGSNDLKFNFLKNVYEITGYCVYEQIQFALGVQRQELHNAVNKNNA